MIKALIKALVTGERLAGYSADAIQKAINASPEDKRLKLANMATRAQQISVISKRITEILADGNISDDERADVQVLLKPMFERMLELI